MPVETPTLFTASAMAKQLGVSDAKVKLAIKELGMMPAAKKGCCVFYAVEELDKLKNALK